MSSLVFLDFDGVICDSIAECLVSSWEAYFGHTRETTPSAVPVDLRAKFAALRPYVRSGEDFLLCQEILHKDLAVRSQEDFDRLAASKGSAGLARLRERFYEARAALRQRDRRYWIGLNSLYPAVAENLSLWVNSPCLHILSTKRPEFINEILAASGILFPGKRILHSDRTDKGARIEKLLKGRREESALLVDDQIDHLARIQAQSGRIAVYLASWGYVKPEWLVGSPVSVLRLEELGAVVGAALRSCR